MDAQYLTNIGIGGTLALLIIREVLGFLKGRKNGHTSAGDKSPEYWENANRHIMSQVIVSTVEPILLQQTKILDELRGVSTRQTEVLIKIAEGQDHIRASLHDLRDQFQVLLFRQAKS